MKPLRADPGSLRDPGGVIEFVPKQDPMVMELLRFWKDIFPDYTKRNFSVLFAQLQRLRKWKKV
jgi:hypothetical protein